MITEGVASKGNVICYHISFGSRPKELQLIDADRFRNYRQSTVLGDKERITLMLVGLGYVITSK